MRVLIIDDEENMRHMLSVILKREGYEVTSFPGADKALKSLDGEDYDFILSDIRMPGLDGLGFLKALKERKLNYTVIMMSAYGTIDTAVECMKLGAYDYISKPFKTDEVLLALKKAEERERLKRENLRLKDEVEKEYDFRNIFTKEKNMMEVLELVHKVASYNTTVLITGESGTGKELVARAIHFCGNRAGGPFVAVNCAAIPSQLLESELFGHTKGAFTDAHKSKVGLFQEAHGGTIFLDEVGELPMELQVKILRVLQESEIRRVGDTKSEKIDTRVVAATVKDLSEEIRKGAFREDLFYRLNVIEVKLPPLRERREDVPGLAELFIEKYAKKFRKPVKGISDDAIEALRAYPWPGNVRELENVIERAVILEEGDTVMAGTLPVLNGASGNGSRADGAGDLSIKKAHEDIEREYIKRALQRTNGNRTKASELLEISHRALLYKIKSYGL